MSEDLITPTEAHPSAKQAHITAGKLTGQKPALKTREVGSTRTRRELDGDVRNLALFNLAIVSKPRDSPHLLTWQCQGRPELGGVGRPEPSDFWHALAETDEGGGHLPQDRKPQSRTAPARAYQAGKHGAISQPRC